jgi:hypothetical protein
VFDLLRNTLNIGIYTERRGFTALLGRLLPFELITKDNSSAEDADLSIFGIWWKLLCEDSELNN